MTAKKLITATEILATTEVKDKSLGNLETCFIEVFTPQEEQIISGGRRLRAGAEFWQGLAVSPGKYG